MDKGKYDQNMVALLTKENEQLWNMIDTKNKVCSQLCEMIADLERRLKNANP